MGPAVALGILEVLPPSCIGQPTCTTGGLPSEYSYLNFGRTKQRGLELGFNATITPSFRTYANYSYQPKPEVNFDESEINQAPKNRFNVGLSGDNGRFFGSFDVNYHSSSDLGFGADIPYPNAIRDYLKTHLDRHPREGAGPEVVKIHGFPLSRE